MSSPKRSSSSWLPLIEYAMRTGVSLSTLRRHIKAGKIQYRVEQGKYLIWHSESQVTQPEAEPSVYLELKRAREEIAELKTLIALYEETLPEHSISS